MANRRFGTANRFGTSNQFGVSTATSPRLKFALEFDWDNNHEFDGFNDATSRLLSWTQRRGREFFFNSGGDGFQAVNEGEMTFTLKNTDRRFDPYYSAGSIFAGLQKNILCRFMALDESTATLYPEFFGYVTDVRPKYGGLDVTEIVVQDGVKKLKDKNISSSSVYAGNQYDQQIVTALSVAGWVDGYNVDETLSDTMPYHWFNGSPAFNELMALVQATFGLFFVDKQGIAVYKSRISSDISVMDLTEADIEYDYGIQAPSPREVVRNSIKVYARARSAQAGVELWRLVDVPLLAGGTGSPIWATYSYNGEEVPVTSVTEPVASTDFTAHQNADGSGTNYTANISWTRTGFATSSKLVPTNSGPDAYLTLMKLRGTAIAADQYTYATATDDESIGVYGERELVINSDWLQSFNTAQEQADLLIDRFASLRFFPRIKVKKSSLDKIFAPDLFDLVSVNFSTKGVTGEMRIGFMEKSWNSNSPDSVECVYYFEPNLTISSSGVWIFPVTLPATLG